MAAMRPRVNTLSEIGTRKLPSKSVIASLGLTFQKPVLVKVIPNSQFIDSSKITSSDNLSYSFDHGPLSQRLAASHAHQNRELMNKNGIRKASEKSAEYEVAKLNEAKNQSFSTTWKQSPARQTGTRIKEQELVFKKKINELGAKKEDGFDVQDYQFQEKTVWDIDLTELEDIHTKGLSLDIDPPKQKVERRSSVKEKLRKEADSPPRRIGRERVKREKQMQITRGQFSAKDVGTESAQLRELQAKGFRYSLPQVFQEPIQPVQLFCNIPSLPLSQYSRIRDIHNIIGFPGQNKLQWQKEIIEQRDSIQATLSGDYQPWMDVSNGYGGVVGDAARLIGQNSSYDFLAKTRAVGIIAIQLNQTKGTASPS
ncbi:hypothetical protein NEOLI_002754 [Neolecta irregularis DAH-3]|uniref:Uncharacterized protein n=1 Tax=Neolecta irregularis (strain DAH-3) TaxID=1198029 RepID=A0A1U7LJ65_NEOID|nr:hypothetical protein NEOLI_002754 [Neolecta irregularis DAH-3]|eukprot:OLL22706.1 hypothetical protein NEOLI_002754 [Neolecta irregularis DAH-3]